MDLALNSYSNDPLDKILLALKEPYEKVVNLIAHYDIKIKNLSELYSKVQKYICEDLKETSDKTAKKILFMYQNILNWKREVEKKKREEERKKAIALKKNKAIALPVELKNGGNRAVVNILKNEESSNLNKFIINKNNPEEIIKDLHLQRKNKSNLFPKNF